jgi:5-methyltetrahydropteroyltriglutamate--homocysteine methyltransferase
MKRSTDRILTTHTGSLPRPDDLVALLRARADDPSPANNTAFRQRARTAIAEVVDKQIEAGIDVISDGEMGKASFVHYIRDRVSGFEGTSQQPSQMDFDGDYPGYSAWRQPSRATTNPFWIGRPECTEPLEWKDSKPLEDDISSLKAAMAGKPVVEGFVPCASVGIVAQRMANAYYPTYEQYVQAVAEVMKTEYHLIADAGLLVQIDAPEMCIDRAIAEFRQAPISEFHKRQELWVEALNYALEGIPEERVRFHVCWGNGEAPHNRDVELKDIVDVVLKVNAGAYSVEASNPRHAHEWKVWQDVKLPEGKVLIPGVIDSVTNFIEHPELVADRIVTYANIVGRENVIAGTDCGFGTSANMQNIYPPIVWGKLKSLSEGAALASKWLWG